jgi:hypothetical protein
MLTATKLIELAAEGIYIFPAKANRKKTPLHIRAA